MGIPRTIAPQRNLSYIVVVQVVQIQVWSFSIMGLLLSVTIFLLRRMNQLCTEKQFAP
jgi:hypothetical protein